MAEEKEIAEGPATETPPPGAGGGGSTDPEPLPMSCEELDFLLGYYQDKLAASQKNLEDTPKWRYRVVNQIKGRIALLKEQIADVEKTKDVAGCP